MKKLILLFLPAILPTGSWSQFFTQYFDGGDTSSFSAVTVETDTTGVWQIGMPQKILFNSASTVPNVLVTDTLNTYGDSLFASAFFDVPGSVINEGGIIAIQWVQQLDLDSCNDVGMLEISTDSGMTWQNAIDFPYVYNFYGYQAGSLCQFPPYGTCFTGTDTVWRNIWYCLDYNVSWLYDNISIRYTLISDSIETNQEGWMIDNLIVQPTWFHPVSEQSKPDNFKLYPTVADQSVTLEQLHPSAEPVRHTVSIVNARGQVIRQIAFTESLLRIDVSDLSPGNYLIRIESDHRKEVHPIVIGR